MPPFRTPTFWQRLRILFNLPRSTRLIYALLKDSRVSLLNKLVLLGLGTTYFLLPVDFVPDLIPFLGQFDDLTVILFLLDRFVASAPAHVVQDYLDRIH